MVLFYIMLDFGLVVFQFAHRNLVNLIYRLAGLSLLMTFIQRGILRKAFVQIF